MKISLKSLKPRNPMVAPSLTRRAGAHRSSTASQRQRAERALQGELARLRSSA